MLHIKSNITAPVFILSEVYCLLFTRLITFFQKCGPGLTVNFEVSRTVTVPFDFSYGISEITGIVILNHSKKSTKMERPQTPPVLIKAEKNPDFCPFCGKIFANLKTLGSHLSEHLCWNNSKISSEEQNTSGLQVTDFVKCEYNTDKKEEVYSCAVCTKEFILKKKLRRHIKEVHSDYRPYQCSKCSKNFKRASELTQHLYIHNDKKRFVCEICGTGFNYKISLTDHKRLHSLYPLLHCKICNRYYKSSQSYRVHLKDVHSERLEEMKWKCKECDCVYAIKSSLKTHIRRKHKGTVSEKTAQPWACSECGRSYSTKKILNEHKRRKHKPQIEIKDIDEKV